jgi:glycosyltransferase involved in cell wall biosynthesis
MASGVPVISSNTGGLPEVNLNGSSGYLSPVGDIKDMSDKALSILKDPKILLKFKKAAKLRATKFDVHQVVSSYEAVYNKALKNCISI